VTRNPTKLSATRKPFMTGNWKLNPQTREEAVTLASEIAAAIGPDSPDVDVALFVPYVFIEAAQKASGGMLMVGAEVCICQPTESMHSAPRIQCSLDTTDIFFIAHTCIFHHHFYNRVFVPRLRAPLREQSLLPCFSRLACNGH
jgi:hypothetical protein